MFTPIILSLMSVKRRLARSETVFREQGLFMSANELADAMAAVERAIRFSPPTTPRKFGGKGYSFDRASGKWKARASFGGRNYNLGYHNTEEQAQDAYNAFVNKYHFTKRPEPATKGHHKTFKRTI